MGGFPVALSQRFRGYNIRQFQPFVGKVPHTGGSRPLVVPIIRRGDGIKATQNWSQLMWIYDLSNQSVNPTTHSLQPIIASDLSLHHVQATTFATNHLGPKKYHYTPSVMTSNGLWPFVVRLTSKVCIPKTNTDLKPTLCTTCIHLEAPNVCMWYIVLVLGIS